MKKILLFLHLTGRYNSNAGESKPSCDGANGSIRSGNQSACHRKPIFDNLVDSLHKLLGFIVRAVQRYGRQLSLICLVAVACCCSGCSVNRVALRTQFKGIPLEIEMISNGRVVSAGNTDCQPNFREF